MTNKVYIERKRYFDRIRPFIDKDLIKVITGQRRVGKSYFLLQVIDFVKKTSPDGQIIFINKELEEFSEITNHIELLKYVKSQFVSKKGKIYLFVDEVQDIKDFEKALHSRIRL